MKKIEPQSQASVCPACGYRDGFHVALSSEDDSKWARVRLICPACHQHFDPGWDIAIRQRP